MGTAAASFSSPHSRTFDRSQIDLRKCVRSRIRALVSRCLLSAVFAVASLSSALAALPASYSLADANLITPVKNQDELGTCWAFSSTTVFESTLVRAKRLTPEAAGNYLSEWDLATHNGVVLSLNAPYGGWGAGPEPAIAYFTRGFGQWRVKRISEPAGGGPVLMANSPRNVYPLAAQNQNLNLRPYLPPTAQPLSPFRLEQAIEFVDTEDGPGKPPAASFIQTIKQAVLRYGALVTNMEWDDRYFNSDYDTFAYTGGSLNTDHDVVIAGWNDAVPVYDKHGQQIGTGAWLIQNSWGTDWGKSSKAGEKPHGYFWLGYMDTAAIKYSCAFVTAPRASISSVVLQNQLFYNESGNNRDQQAGFASGTRSLAATKLTAQNQTKLLALGLWTLNDRTPVDVSIYAGWGERGPVGEPLAMRRNVLVPLRGYNEIPLATPLDLATGQTIYIVVDFGARFSRPIAIDPQTLALRDEPTFSGLSWMSSDGANWSDLATNGDNRGIFFFKGIQGREKYRINGAVLSVTHSPGTVSAGGTAIVRGIASNNATAVLWRVGKSGKVRRAQGRTAWKIVANGLPRGTNVLYLWPVAARGVATTPTRVAIIQR
jgi:hypothetical protein